MTITQVDQLMKAFGELPSHSRIGGYPLFYLVENGDVLCPKCATKLYNHRITYIHPPTINWESEIYCDDCGEEIESAY